MFVIVRLSILLVPIVKLVKDSLLFTIIVPSCLVAAPLAAVKSIVTVSKSLFPSRLILSVVAPETSKAVKSELPVTAIPPAAVIVPTIVAVTKFPFVARDTVAKVPAVVTVVKSP